MKNSLLKNKIPKVLIIAGFFPPASGVGTFRITKFVKYLQEYLWEPVVITLTEESYSPLPLDYSLISDIPKGVKIIRTKVCQSKYLNDIGLRWIPYLFLQLRETIAKEKPSIIFYTAGPFYPLIIAPFIKILYKLDYIIDLRDPWKLSFKDENLPSKRSKKEVMGRYLSNIFEPLILKNAKKIICVSDEMRDEYKKEYKNIPTDNFMVITNGYDEEDFPTHSPSKFEKFTIVYTGKFLVGKILRDPSIFFQSLKSLLDNGYEINFIHVGKIEDIILEKAKYFGILDAIEFVGDLSYKDCINISKKADLLLLIGGGQRSEQTGKIFDYLGCKNPILALARLDGGIEKIARHIPHATIHENDNSFEIASIIEELYKNRNAIQNNNFDLSIYSRKYLTYCLSNMLNDVTSSS